jgi:hypothetical protein
MDAILKSIALKKPRVRVLPDPFENPNVDVVCFV